MQAGRCRLLGELDRGLVSRGATFLTTLFEESCSSVACNSAWTGAATRPRLCSRAPCRACHRYTIGGDLQAHSSQLLQPLRHRGIHGGWPPGAWPPADVRLGGVCQAGAVRCAAHAVGRALLEARGAATETAARRDSRTVQRRLLFAAGPSLGAEGDFGKDQDLQTEGPLASPWSPGSPHHGCHPSLLGCKF